MITKRFFTFSIVVLAVFALAMTSPGCSSGNKSSRSSSTGGGGGGGTGTGGTGTGGTGTGGTGGNGGGAVEPPLGGSSDGSGGGGSQDGVTTSSGVTYNLIVPGSYSDSKPNEFLIVYSGTEGADQMTRNVRNIMGIGGLGSFICAILDGVAYYGNGQAGADVLADVRSKFNVDNDRTCLMGESAGTGAALQLGFRLRQSYFAAYWANDVNCSDTPGQTAAEIGFAPWGNAGPGGDWPDANTIVDGMRNAGYRLPDDAPYSGPGADSHGHPDQLMAAFAFFPGKSRQ